MTIYSWSIDWPRFRTKEFVLVLSTTFIPQAIIKHRVHTRPELRPLYLDLALLVQVFLVFLSIAGITCRLAGHKPTPARGECRHLHADMCACVRKHGADRLTHLHHTCACSSKVFLIAARACITLGTGVIDVWLVSLHAGEEGIWKQDRGWTVKRSWSRTSSL